MINNSISDEDAQESVYYSIEREELLGMASSVEGRVLEVGCGAGLTLALAKRMGAVEVVGIELRPDVALAASRNPLLDSILSVDFNEVSEESLNGKFDLVLLSHVLEHFSDPSVVLEKIKNLLKPTGELLLAVPNVRHISVLGPLLWSGSFDYVESGILDNTHLRFFTRSSIVKMLRESGWKVNKVLLENGGPRARVVSAMTLGFFDEFVSYAINISASPIGAGVGES